ncbi:hypothetical protein MNBD_GAMMA10-2767 [hydrothermal vent metagenome]|uniref:HTH cro/C1-type domain-containing protein n=1 Tax=hydrothermal vent metagenome TaxID=652676 RepID=A0A3B0XKW9_9ZZZZ
MAMTENLLSALKHVFHNRGITYKDAAAALELSEVSIKRLFSEKNCSLLRLEKLCELANTDFTQLLAIAESQQQQLTQLSLQQEKMLVSDIRYLVVAVCIINRWRFEQILARYQFSEAQLTGVFTKLDKFGLIELLTENRYRLKVSRCFSWLPDGPIQTFFLESVLQSYLEGGIQNDASHFRFIWGMLTKESVNELNRKIHRLLDEYTHIAEQDIKIPIENKLTSSLLIMFRENWEPDSFRQHWK